MDFEEAELRSTGQWHVEKHPIEEYGMIDPLCGGIQIDVNAVTKAVKGELYESSLCNHNCTTEHGGYTCPASFSLNKGIKPTYASSTNILGWINASIKGIRTYRDSFMKDGFKKYCKNYNIPKKIRKVLRENLFSSVVEINLFGGNPEMHPEIEKIIEGLWGHECTVTLTTTGRRALQDKNFLKNPLHKPDMLALSADDFTPDNLDKYLKMSMDDLKKEWKTLSPYHGQAQKAIEAIYVARANRFVPEKLFNLVIHPGNIDDVIPIYKSLSHNFLTDKVNPFVYQSAFMYEADLPSMEFLSKLNEIVQFFTEETVNKKKGITKRLHYWLVLQAILTDWEVDPIKTGWLLTGKAWKCYENPSLGYLQIGRSPYDVPSPQGYPAGGKLGCFWNDRTVTESSAIEDSKHVTEYMLKGMAAKAKASDMPCWGCLMPRLMFNMVSTETGLEKSILPEYLKLRTKYLGF
jgi:hypothetical protein